MDNLNRQNEYLSACIAMTAYKITFLTERMQRLTVSVNYLFART